jgi:hypothetical protein
LKDSCDIWDHPQNEKAPRRNQKSLGGFTFKTFRRRAFIAISRLAVILKVNGNTELCGKYEKDRPFGENVQVFYVTDKAPD